MKVNTFNQTRTMQLLCNRSAILFAAANCVMSLCNEHKVWSLTGESYAVCKQAERCGTT